MADERVEVTCHGCGHAFPTGRSGRGRLAECPGCGGWIGVAADGPPPEPAVSPAEFERAQRGPAGRRRRAARGGGADSCGA